MYCVELGLVRRNGELDVLYFIVSVLDVNVLVLYSLLTTS